MIQKRVTTFDDDLKIDTTGQCTAVVTQIILTVTSTLTTILKVQTKVSTAESSTIPSARILTKR